MSETSELHAEELAGPSDRLRNEFNGAIPPEAIHQALLDATEELASQAKVHTFVPMLAERRTRERLSALVGR